MRILNVLKPSEAPCKRKAHYLRTCHDDVNVLHLLKDKSTLKCGMSFYPFSVFCLGKKIKLFFF